MEKFSSEERRKLHLPQPGRDFFFKVSRKWGFDETGVSYGLALADFDRDGDLDAAVASMENPYLLYRNDSQEGATVLIRLMGRDRNRWGIGATVRIETELGSHWRTLSSSQGYASANAPLLHFGLGKAKAIKKMEVTWPRGEIQKFADLAVDRRYTVVQPDAGLSRSEKMKIELPFFINETRRPSHRYATPGKPRR